MRRGFNLELLIFTLQWQIGQYFINYPVTGQKFSLFSRFNPFYFSFGNADISNDIGKLNYIIRLIIAARDAYH